MKQVYADNAATTRVLPCVAEKMMKYYTEEYGNPSSIYDLGRRSAIALEEARETVAKCIGAKASEIVFTGCGSEADSHAIFGVAEKYESKGKHIITSSIEHHAVSHALKELEKRGFEVTYLPVYKNGIVRVEDVKAAIRPDTILITIMFANNEIGTIQPISEIGKLAREHKILFHTDAVQAVGHIPVDVEAMNIDLLSMSGHKFHAPKGVGALYIRRGVAIPNLIYGGAQERNRRAGTENVASIIGMAEALKYSCENMKETSARLTKMRDRLIDGVLASIPYCRLNGDREKRMPGNANFSIEYIEGESILLRLDMFGIAASSGSACTSGSLDPSHVLLAIGLPHEVAHGSLRLSFGDENTEEDVDYILETLPGVVQFLRDMSPVYDNVVKGKVK